MIDSTFDNSDDGNDGQWNLFFDEYLTREFAHDDDSNETEVEKKDFFQFNEESESTSPCSETNDLSSERESVHESISSNDVPNVLERCATSGSIQGRKRRKLMFENGSNFNDFVRTVPKLIHEAAQTGNIDEVASIVSKGFDENCVFRRSWLLGDDAVVEGRHHIIDFHASVIKLHPDNIQILKDVKQCGNELVCKLTYCSTMNFDKQEDCSVVELAQGALKSKGEAYQKERKNFSFILKGQQSFTISETTGRISEVSYSVAKVIDIYQAAPRALPEGLESIPVNLFNAMNAANIAEVKRIVSAHYDEECTLNTARGPKLKGWDEITGYYSSILDSLPDIVFTARRVEITEGTIVCDCLISATMVGDVNEWVMPGTTAQLKAKLASMTASGNALVRQSCAGLLLLHVHSSTGLIHDASMTIRAMGFHKCF